MVGIGGSIEGLGDWIVGRAIESMKDLGGRFYYPHFNVVTKHTINIIGMNYVGDIKLNACVFKLT